MTNARARTFPEPVAAAAAATRAAIQQQQQQRERRLRFCGDVEPMRSCLLRCRKASRASTAGLGSDLRAAAVVAHAAPLSLLVLLAGCSRLRGEKGRGGQLLLTCSNYTSVATGAYFSAKWRQRQRRHLYLSEGPYLSR